MRPIVTLISDWRTRDPYVAMFKGTLLSFLPDVEILDISHVVEFYNLRQTAFLAKQSFQRFPEGTIHIMLTGIYENSKCTPVVMEYQNHYFIGDDNGLFFMMFNMEFPVKCFRYTGEETNSLRRIAHLSQAICNGSKETVSEEFDCTKLKRLFAPIPLDLPLERTIEGEIVYIDAHFNAVTNIPTETFKNLVQNGTFEAVIQSQREWKCQIYHDTYKPEEEFYLTSNALGCLEITMYQASVSILADFKPGDKVTIKY